MTCPIFGTMNIHKPPVMFFRWSAKGRRSSCTSTSNDALEDAGIWAVAQVREVAANSLRLLETGICHQQRLSQSLNKPKATGTNIWVCHFARVCLKRWYIPTCHFDASIVFWTMPFWALFHLHKGTKTSKSILRPHTQEVPSRLHRPPDKGSSFRKWFGEHLEILLSAYSETQKSVAFKRGSPEIGLPPVMIHFIFGVSRTNGESSSHWSFQWQRCSPIEAWRRAEKLLPLQQRCSKRSRRVLEGRSLSKPGRCANDLLKVWSFGWSLGDVLWFVADVWWIWLIVAGVQHVGLFYNFAEGGDMSSNLCSLWRLCGEIVVYRCL